VIDEHDDDEAAPASRTLPREATSRRTEHAMEGWLFMAFGAGVQGILSVAVLLVLARLLSPAEFGTVSAALLVINFSLVFAQAGVGPAIVQHPDLRTEHIRSAFALSLYGGLVLLALLLGFARPLASMLTADGVVPVLQVLAWLLPVQGVTIVAESLLRRDLEFAALARAKSISFVVGYATVGISVALAGGGLWALAAAHAAQVVTYSVLVVRRRPHARGVLLDRLATRELLSFGGGFTLARLGNSLALYGDKLVVVRWLGPGALGVYERAYQLMAMPATAIGQVLDEVLFPAMAQVQSDTARLARAYRRCIAGIALLTLPLSMVVMILAPEIVDLLLGAQWTMAVGPLRVLALGTMLRTSYKISDSLARALGAVYKRAWRQWVYAALAVGGGIIGQQWGIVGVAAGVLVALLTNYILMAQLSLRLIDMPWGEFLAAHGAGIRTSAFLAPLVWLVAHTGRAVLDLPSALTLILSLGAAGMGCVLLYVVSPALLLGEDSQWLLDRLGRVVSNRLRRFRRAPHPA